MSDKQNSENKNSKNPKKKLPPEMQSLKDEINSNITSLKKDINADMHTLIDPIKVSLDILLEMKSTWEIGLKECQAVRCENTELRLRIEKVETENKRLTTKVTMLEDKMMEGNILFQGVPESIWDPSKTVKENVLTAISHTISGDTIEDRMDQARQIPIKDIK